MRPTCPSAVFFARLGGRRFILLLLRQREGGRRGRAFSNGGSGDDGLSINVLSRVRAFLLGEGEEGRIVYGRDVGCVDEELGSWSGIR